jgi:hypothetical protein
MSWAAVAAIGGALISAGAGIYSSNKASKAQQGASADSIAESRRQFDTVMGLLQPQIQFGTGALDQLSRLYGRGPIGGTAGQLPGPAAGTPQVAPGSASAFLPAPQTFGETSVGKAVGFDTVARPMLNPAADLADRLGMGPNTTVGKVLDPVGFGLGKIFGSKKGDEKRNLQAFLGQNKVYDLGSGMLQLEDGTIFPQSELEWLAGTWYGATYAPDGDQQGWQQKFNDTLGRLKASPWNANRAGAASGQGYMPTPGGGVQPILQAGPATIDNATGQVIDQPTGMDVFFASPDYQFNLAEGQKAIDRSAAARGGLLSGRAVKEGTRYASGLASREYASFVDRLMQQAGLGSTGIGAATSAALSTGSNVSNAITNAGNARASGYLNTGMAVNNAVQGGISNFLLSRYLNSGG